MLAPLLGLLLAQSPPAFDPWTPEEAAAETAYVALHLVDWMQTREIGRRSRVWTGDLKYHEINPLIGPRPSRARVNLYMAASLALQLGIAHALPRDVRGLWIGLSIEAKGGLVGLNISMGL